ncbi:MAG: hypothetical protein UX46_C0014G0001, partial [Candidatus Amesbacteria bacterium GW2011_GWC1_46_24]
TKSEIEESVGAALAAPASADSAASNSATISFLVSPEGFEPSNLFLKRESLYR